MGLEIKGNRGRGARRTLLCALAVVLPWVLTAPALAAPTTVAGYGSASGKVKLPEGVAVDQENGHLYVADRGNFRIDRFDAGGRIQLAWGWGVADGASQEPQTCGPEAGNLTSRCFGGRNVAGAGAVAPEAVAVDPTSGDVYVADSLYRRVTKFGPSGDFLFMLGRDVNKTKAAEEGPGVPYTQVEKNICTAADEEDGDECGAGLSGVGLGEFAEPSSLALDPEGHIWVGDSNRIEGFAPDGSFFSEALLPGLGFEPVSALASTPAGDLLALRRGLKEIQLITPPASGVYTLSFEGRSTGPIEHDASNQTVERELEALEGIGEGNILVQGGGGVKKQVIFTEELALQDVEQIGGSSGVTVATVRNGAPGAIEERDPTGGLLSTPYTGAPQAFAADAAGELYVGECAMPPACRDYRLLRLSSSGELVSRFDAGQVIGAPEGNALALDEGSETRPPALYAASSSSNEDQSVVQAFPLPEPGPLPDNSEAEGVLPTSATLSATLNPEGAVTHYRFQYVAEAAYEEDIAEGGDGFEGPATVETPEEELAGSEYEDEAVSAAIAHLIPETAYRFRLVAENEDAEAASAGASFTTLPAIGIEAQWASALSAREATLNAELDPLGVPVKVWWLEYGTSPCSQGGCAKAAEGSLPAGFGATDATVRLSGLKPSATYHYRFVAEDERVVKEGEEIVKRVFSVQGADRTFTTQGSGLGFALPDSRAWEMVSPPDKHGARLRSPSEGQVQAATDGNALAYLSRGSIEARPEGNRSPEDSSVLARRVGAGEWASKDLTPPNRTVVAVATGAGLEYKLFSPDLSEALLEPRGLAPLSPWASERTPYLRNNTDSPPTYVPLVVGCPAPPEPCDSEVQAHANVPTGTEFGGDPTAVVGEARIAGATPNLHHVVLSFLKPKTAVGPLYEWKAGDLSPVSVLPGEEGVVGAQLAAGSGRGAISEDGSRIFFSASGGLYVRDLARGETARLDVVQPGAFGTGDTHPVFQGADSEGSVAFFTDTRNLTADANEAGRDLYRCEVVVEAADLMCELSDLTAQTENSVDPFESAEVGGVLGMGDDATRLFFVANGVLDSRPNVHGENAIPGQPNLYVWQRGEGIRFQRVNGGSNVTVSPSGRYLAFMSQLPLTGYDNRDARSGERDQEIFLYDSAENRLLCASCNPSGARPEGTRGFDNVGLPPAYDHQGLWKAKPGVPAPPLAAVLPEATKLSLVGALIYRPRAIHDNGRLFFNAADSLVPADSNGDWDVYQYEPDGTGSCAASSGDAATARSAGGCVSLISSGTGEGESAFVDASEGGDDVFFWSDAQLSVLDEDHVTDIYDARVDGVPATLHPVAECLGEACQPPASAPPRPTPPTAAVAGNGNVRGTSRCANLSRRVQGLSSRARRLRRHARKVARNSKKRPVARQMGRRARRLSHRAQSLSKRARRCRRANRGRSSK